VSVVDHCPQQLSSQLTTELLQSFFKDTCAFDVDSPELDNDNTYQKTQEMDDFMPRVGFMSEHRHHYVIALGKLV
jgi:hypothetical protein